MFPVKRNQLAISCLAIFAVLNNDIASAKRPRDNNSIERKRQQPQY
jgi:hypothetical protein